MKKIRYTLILILWLVTAPLYAQDYYSGKTSIKGNFNEYVVEDFEGMAIQIWNKNNKYPIYTSYPYLKGTKEQIRTRLKSKPDTTVVTNILDTVFTTEEQSAYNATSNYIRIRLNVNPLTGKVIEVRCIILCEDIGGKVDKTLLSIPITKLEELEQLIIQRIVFDVPEAFKTANFMTAWFTIFDNRPK